LTFRADKLPPPPKTENFNELYRWYYRVFELMNGIIEMYLYQTRPEKGVASGYAELDASSMIPDARIPATITRDAEAAAAYAPIAKGVTNGDTHDHVGGDGAQIDHAGLANLATGDPHTQYQQESEKNAASGYAGLNASSRITKGAITTDDLIVDLATKGLVLKDTQGTPHYWRGTISTLGVLTFADLGVTKP
jgi:hypothetical protein